MTGWSTEGNLRAPESAETTTLVPTPNLESEDKSHDDGTHRHSEPCWDRLTEMGLLKEGLWVKVDFSLAHNFPRHHRVDSANVFTGRRAKLAANGASPGVLRSVRLAPSLGLSAAQSGVLQVPLSLRTEPQLSQAWTSQSSAGPCR